MAAPGEFDRIVTSNLLEAELRVAFEWEGVPFERDLVSRITSRLAGRPLDGEMELALAAGHLRTSVRPGATHRASQEVPCARWSTPLARVSSETSGLES